MTDLEKRKMEDTIWSKFRKLPPELILNISERLDKAYDDGYKTGYLQAEFDYKQEIEEELQRSYEKMHPPGLMQNNSSHRAKWISQPVFYSTIGSLWVKWQCGCCGYIRTAGWEHTEDGKKPKAIFCEKCGADMREEQDG